MKWERRDTEREPFEGLINCNSMISTNGKLIELQEPLDIEITNISQKGIGFESNVSLDVGSTLIFKVILSYETKITYKVNIRWKDDSNEKYIYGGYFVNEDSTSLDLAKSIFSDIK